MYSYNNNYYYSLNLHVASRRVALVDRAHTPRRVRADRVPGAAAVPCEVKRCFFFFLLSRDYDVVVSIPVCSCEGLTRSNSYTARAHRIESEYLNRPERRSSVFRRGNSNNNQ